MRGLLLLLFVLTLPFPLFAENNSISRRDGFLMIWESIRRPVGEYVEQTFVDVVEGDRGFEEISYAASRGILDDCEYFVPEERLTMEDALLWLFRSRNVRDLEHMQQENLSGMIREYPVIEYPGDLGAITVSRDALLSIQRLLDTMLMEEVHGVSFYADDFHGRGTAFGETFDMHELTAAHRTLPENTLVKVTNVDNRKSVTVRINDRGPYIDGRDMDLSLSAFKKIADPSQGVLHATFRRLGDEELIDTCTQEVRRFQKRITKNVRFHRGIPHTWNVGETLYLGANRYFVVRGIRYPDGSFMKVQDWVGPKERFSFTPSVEGEYVFLVGNKDGRRREMMMTVHSCGAIDW